MSAKSLFLFLAAAAAVLWFVLKDDKHPAEKPVSLTAGHQQQMQKAADLGKDMQKSLDERMQSPAASGD